MELNREQIIKALELCKSPVVSDCNACPYKGKSIKDGVYVGCTSVLMRDAFSLIKELTQANEMLSESYDHLEKTKDELLAERSRLTEENERLKAEKESGNKELFHKWKKLADETADRFEGLYEDAKKALVTDTVRKMQTEIEARCIKGGIYPAFVKSTIDKVAEEMIKGEKP